ncbi:MAG TPA: gamma-glutamyl-gamma-aminobutyrate hydrolase family protein [Acidisarcina sp.]
MSATTPRIAVPLPTLADLEYNQRAWPQFAHALRCCGAIAVPIPLDSPQSVIAKLASTCSGILLPGSPADLNPQKYGQEPVPECAPPDPAREAVDELLLQDAFNLYKPIFGVCYGLQSLNVWRNGTLIQHLTGAATTKHDNEGELQQAHTVAVATASNLEQLLAPARDAQRVPTPSGDTLEIRVNSSHHQAVGDPGDGLAMVARSVDDGVIEALEGRNPDQYVLGVQWHPERTFGVSAASRLLFEALVEAARAWQPRHVTDSVAQETVAP